MSANTIELHAPILPLTEVFPVPEVSVYGEQHRDTPATLEVLSDAEVASRFAAMVEGIDAASDPAYEAVLDAQPTRKTNGSAESFSMWKP